MSIGDSGLQTGSGVLLRRLGVAEGKSHFEDGYDNKKKDLILAYIKGVDIDETNYGEIEKRIKTIFYGAGYEKEEKSKVLDEPLKQFKEDVIQ